MRRSTRCINDVSDAKRRQQGAIGQFAACRRQCGIEDALVALAGADEQREATIRLGQAKIVDQVHIHERRYEQNLPGVLPDFARIRLDRCHVGVTLAERVVNLVDHGGQFTIGPVAEIDTDRVEAVAERARHAEQADSAACEFDSGLCQQPFGLRT